MKKTYSLLSTIVLLLSYQIGLAQNTISIDLKTQKYIGDVSDLDRKKYFNIHHTYISWELNENNYDTELLDNLGIGYGRQFAGPGSGNPNFSNGKSTSYPTASQGTTIGNSKKNGWDDNPTYFERMTDEVIVTDHPYTAFVFNGNFDQAADYSAAYMKAAFQNQMPKYYEVMNEPFVHVTDFAGWNERHQVIDQMSTLWKKVADKIHTEIPGLKIGGYASAYPEMEQNNFGHFEERMKVFMDKAGSSVDFYSTHFYDGSNVLGQDQNRSGSNSEAIMDLIEAYNFKTYGTVKPHLISEYGKTVKSWTKDDNGNKDPKPYSEARDGEVIKSMNAFLFQFLEKPDRILKTIPFITAKSTFFYSSQNPDQHPYPWVLLKKESDGSYSYTHLVKFFQLWKDVQGKRVDVTSTDHDLVSNVFVNGNKVYIALHNMESATKSMNLDLLNNSGSTITGVTVRKLYNNASGVPNLSYTDYTAMPGSISLGGGETAVIVATLSSNMTFNNVIREKNYYTTEVLNDITAGTAISYPFANVEKGSGRAAIRLGIGRDHGKSLQPVVKVNGTPVTVPTDWKGYSQYNRTQFFGVIEIPFDIALLNSGNNTVTVEFGDTGGKVSSVILTTEVIDGTVVSPSTESVSLAQAPTTITSQTSYTVNVEYTANQQRELVLEFWKGNTWIKSTITTVNAGTGVKAITVNPATAPALGTDYIWKAQIRPVGSSWQNAIDTDQINSVSVISNITDNVSLIQASTTLESATSYSVNVEYAASAQRELVLEFWKGNTWIQSTITTVTSGTGTEMMTVNLASEPADGADYIWKAQIRPVGSSWQEATDTDQINSVTVNGNLLINANIEAGNLDAWGAKWGGFQLVTTGQRSGAYGAKVTGAGALSQVVTGLSPNTTYTLSTYGKVNAGQVAKLGVKEHGNAQVAVDVTSTAYTLNTITFTTGATNTSAQVYFYVPSTGHVGHADDWKLVKGTGNSRLAQSGTVITDKATLLADINVYPNPSASGIFNIQTSATSPIAYRVLALDGKTFAHGVTENSTTTIELGRFTQQKGMYLLELRSGDQVVRKKVMYQ